MADKRTLQEMEQANDEITGNCILAVAIICFIVLIFIIIGGI